MRPATRAANVTVAAATALLVGGGLLILRLPGDGTPPNGKDDRDFRSFEAPSVQSHVEDAAPPNRTFVAQLTANAGGHDEPAASIGTAYVLVPDPSGDPDTIEYVGVELPADGADGPVFPEEATAPQAPVLPAGPGDEPGAAAGGPSTPTDDGGADVPQDPGSPAPPASPAEALPSPPVPPPPGGPFPHDGSQAMDLCELLPSYWDCPEGLQAGHAQDGSMTSAPSPGQMGAGPTYPLQESPIATHHTPTLAPLMPPSQQAVVGDVPHLAELEAIPQLATLDDERQTATVDDEYFYAELD